jgi:myo-inositol-1(or 4)-monophosphatase
MNGERLPLKAPPTDLNRCMAGIELKRIDRTLAGRLAFEHPFSSQRNLGSSTLDWCYVAAGRMHIYLHGGQKLWDYAAGCLILNEAGGASCALDGSPFNGENPWCRSVLAALTPDLLQQWKDWVCV